MLKYLVVSIAITISCASVHSPAAAQANAQTGAQSNDLSVKLYGESAKSDKSTDKSTEKKSAEAAVKSDADAGGGIIRCVDKGRVTFTNGKCEGGSAQSVPVRRAEPATNQVTRSGNSGTPPKPLAALPPLYETVQATNSTAGYELREQCDKIDLQINRLDAQAQLALPKAEPEASRKKREELLRKRHSLRCP